MTFSKWENNMDKPSAKYHVVNAIMNYESGEPSFEDTVILFQYLHNTGMIDHLQGSYGRIMAQLIREGYIDNCER